MGMTYQADRAWANTSKGIRQCQKADKALVNGKVDSASRHFSEALNYFATAVDHLAKAAEDADVKAGKLLDDGNQQLQKALDRLADGDTASAGAHYEKALDKYDEALDLIN